MLNCTNYKAVFYYKPVFEIFHFYHGLKSSPFANLEQAIYTRNKICNLF